jgi:cytochrome P450
VGEALEVARERPPGPGSVMPVLAALAIRRDPLRFLTDTARTYGDLVHLQLGPRRDYLVNRPDWIREVLLAPEEQMLRSFPRTMTSVLGDGLLSSQGAHHRTQRRKIQPFFNHARLEGMAEVVTRHAGGLCDGWTEAQAGAIDALEAMLGLTLQIILEVVFHRDLDDHAGALMDAVGPLVGSTRKKGWGLFGARRRANGFARFGVFLSEVIARRREDDIEGPDLLSMLLALGSDDRTVRNEALTMFVAGHETIGNCLAWTWHLLSQNPEAEARLHAEVDALGRPPRAEDTARLSFAGRVVNESMRLYPPAWLMTRRPVEDFPLAGFVLPAGSYVHVSQYLMHRDPRYFPDPERFDPDRWLPERECTRPKFSYFPFGGGGRKCVGESFAVMEGVLVLATVAQRYRLRAIPGHRVEPEPYVTLRPRNGLPMRVERRLRS